ncbi:MAG: hypothetical protein LBP80_03005 [Treponema sp.]|jgi:hypothetical protein|nr:hypothetical protein [Treponema sp.]
MKRFCYLFALILGTSVCFAEDPKSGLIIAPLVNYEYLHLAGQQFHAPGEGVSFIYGDEQKPFFAQVLAKQYIMGQDNRDGYEGPYHSDSLTLVQKIKRHQFMALLNARSNEPVYGGLRTFTAGIGYDYELLRNDHHSLVLGGVLTVTDTGITFVDGKTWPVMPLPLITYELRSQLLTLKASYMLKPQLDFTVLPESRIRLTSSLSMEKYRSIADLLFDCALWYRFFDKNSKQGDCAGFGAGIKNTGLYFNFGEKDKSYELQYYSVYGTLDFSILQISGGYCFRGREILDSSGGDSIGNDRSAGEGYFASIRLVYSFH